jgi:hypothetical protein
MPMTPDEVVKELEIHYQTNCMVGDIGVAIKSAISLLQDYQKLRGRMNDKDNFATNIRGYFNPNTNRENDLIIEVAKKCLTYLQQPTEH